MEINSTNALWDEYGRSRSPEIREKIILEYAPLVKLVAGRLSMYLGYNVEYDDLVGYGIFGLIDAIDKFDIGKDVKFETYASLRIRGAMLDHIRKMDWIPRTVRQRQRKIDEALKKLESEVGRNVSDAEVAAELGISEEEYTEWQSQLMITNVVSLNEFMEQGGDGAANGKEKLKGKAPGPEEIIEKAELKKMLMEALEKLTEREKKVILLYYYEDLTLKEISKIMEVSESRISQLHVKALNKMKKKLGKYLGILTERV
ncbi:MAG: FliA/WhiG family RNA polymerase sigma factor [Lachnospiraceae bacterium]|nr:FliA/WhiG family RNA polymerase sigma factor [Lachnospiraceae bacterium]